MAEVNRCNILILGRSGAGKSSLLNYILEKEIEKTGIGKSQTPKGIYPHDIKIKGAGVTLYDSWGLEAGEAHEWEDLVCEELKKHDIDKEISEWMHAAIYCINSASNRVEDIEERIIARLLNKGLCVVVAFTHADLSTAKKDKELEDAIEVGLEKSMSHIPNKAANKQKKEHIFYVPICSNSKKTKTRGGAESEPFGKDKLVQKILENYKTSVIERLPERISFLLKNEVMDAKQVALQKYGDVIKHSSEKDKFKENFGEQQKAFYEYFVPRIIKNELVKVNCIWENLNIAFSMKSQVEIKEEFEARNLSFWGVLRYLFIPLAALGAFFPEIHVDVEKTYSFWIKRFDEESFKREIRNTIAKYLQRYLLESGKYSSH